MTFVTVFVVAAAKISYSVRMPNKPIRDGIKILALCCAKTGYNVAFCSVELYGLMPFV